MLKPHLLTQEPRCALATAVHSPLLIKGQLGCLVKGIRHTPGGRLSRPGQQPAPAPPTSTSEAVAFSSHPLLPKAHSMWEAELLLSPTFCGGREWEGQMPGVYLQWQPGLGESVFQTKLDSVPGSASLTEELNPQVAAEGRLAARLSVQRLLALPTSWVQGPMVPGTAGQKAGQLQTGPSVQHTALAPRHPPPLVSMILPPLPCFPSKSKSKGPPLLESRLL